MATRIWLALSLTMALLVLPLLVPSTPACCPAPPSGKPVVNADQTVLIVWDSATKTEHFIRKASFKSAADDFGFLVPTSAQPELDESGNEAFPYLHKLTEPERRRIPRPSGGIGCGCSSSVTVKREHNSRDQTGVQVLMEKEVAGFQAVVLEANSADALTDWLKAHGYAFSPEVKAWAKPYVEAGWKITAFKVAKDKNELEKQNVAASALRMSFKTERPLFPYREPDYKSAAKTLTFDKRMLRIYFIAEARYQGELTKETAWTGKVAWTDKLSADDRKKALEFLNLPATTGPEVWWLTEFEDEWAYRVAPADVVFSRDTDQSTVKRDPIVEYVSSPWPTDIMIYAFAAFVIVPSLLRRVRRAR
jgi:hypothetical protein